MLQVETGTLGEVAVGGEVLRFIEPAATVLEVAGVAVIVAGVVIATVVFARQLRGGFEQACERYRANLGRGILLGLEVLVAADIIATVTAPLTFRSVGLLAVIVLIRTFLSFSLEVEIEGRWPWKGRAAEPR